ncbi:hypothetical protein D6D28_01603, partial [Aureobasidium pullulans]
TASLAWKTATTPGSSNVNPHDCRQEPFTTCFNLFRLYRSAVTFALLFNLEIQDLKRGKELCETRSSEKLDHIHKALYTHSNASGIAWIMVWIQDTTVSDDRLKLDLVELYVNLSSSSSFLPYDYLFCQSLIYTFTAEEHQNNIKMYTSIALLAASAGLATAATSYKASFTQYGSTDTWGSGNCNVATTACGFYTSPGYSAAVSQNEFGVGTGAGAGPACGTCWKLTASTDSSGNSLSFGAPIVVQVTNLCPAESNPLCAQNGLTGTNQYGANLNFDLCIDSGASAALFGSTGVGLAVGSAEQVDCSSWSGKVVS